MIDGIAAVLVAGEKSSLDTVRYRNAVRVHKSTMKE